MRSLIIIVIFLVFFEQSNAFLVKISKDNHINQPGYITTITGPNIQAVDISNDGTKLFSIFRADYDYCLNVTKLSYSINTTGSFTHCFGNQNVIGSKITEIVVAKSANAFYIFSNHKLIAYSISPITTSIKGKIFSQRFTQKIVEAKLINDGKNLYVLTASSKSESGKVINYRVNSDGSLTKVSSESLSYKPKKIKFNNVEYMYIQSSKDIYRYELIADGSVIKDDRIITIPSGNILDFDIIAENSTDSKLVLAIQDTIENSNVEKGAIAVYKDSSGLVRLLYNINYDNLPREVVSFRDKATNQEIFLVAFDYKYEVNLVNSLNAPLIFTANLDGSFLKLLKKDNLAEIVSTQSSIIYDLKENNRLAVFFLKDIQQQQSFLSRKIIGVGNQSSINIFQL